MCGADRMEVKLLLEGSVGFVCSVCAPTIVYACAEQDSRGRGPYLAEPLVQSLAALDPKTRWAEVEPLLDAAMHLVSGDTVLADRVAWEAFRFQHYARALAALDLVSPAARTAWNRLHRVFVCLVLEDRAGIAVELATLDALSLSPPERHLADLHRAWATFRLERGGEPYFTPWIASVWPRSSARSAARAHRCCSHEPSRSSRVSSGRAIMPPPSLASTRRARSSSSPRSFSCEVTSRPSGISPRRARRGRAHARSPTPTASGRSERAEALARGPACGLGFVAQRVRHASSRRTRAASAVVPRRSSPSRADRPSPSVRDRCATASREAPPISEGLPRPRRRFAQLPNVSLPLERTGFGRAEDQHLARKYLVIRWRTAPHP